MKRFIRRVVLAMLAGVALYGVFVAYAGWQAIRTSMAGFSWLTFAAALGLASLNYALRFGKWQYYLARLQVRGVAKVDSLLIFLSGFVLTVTPGKVGEVFKSAVLAETHRVPVARTAPIVVAERLTDLVGIIVLIAAGSAGFSGGLPWAAAGSALVVIGLLFIFWPTPMLGLISAIERGPARIAKLGPKLREAFESLRILASPSALLLPTLLSILAWGAEGVALWVLLRGFGLELSTTLAVFFYSTATLAGAIVPVPGGLGVAETMIEQQLVRLGGVPHGPATAAMILVRFATLWWAVLVGFMALALLRARHPHLLSDRPELVAPAAAPPEP